MLAEFACGQAAPGVPMKVDSLTAWFSASKPVTAMAIAILLDRGQVALDDRVSRYLPAFGNGKEACTIRQVLTHQGGFAGALDDGEEGSWEEIIGRICGYPAEYPPGARAGYHPTSGWYVLAEILHIVDGRTVGQFVSEELFTVLGMSGSYMGVPLADQAALGGRLARVDLGQTERQQFATREFVDRFNGPQEMTRVNPSGGIRGPAGDLTRFYSWLLAGGKWADRQLVDSRTVALFTACHRWDMPDTTLMGANLAWGLGFSLFGNADIGRAASRRVFGHSGMVSSIGLGDPETGLAVAIVTTGLLDPMTNARRLRRASAAAFDACR